MVTRSLCTFDIAGQRFGLETARIQEVVRVDRLTAVPRARDDVAGLLNLRGLIVLAVDASLRLDLAPATTPTGSDDASSDPVTTGRNNRPVAVVLSSPEGTMALLVDEVHEILQVDESLFIPSQDRDGSPVARLVRGAYRTHGELTMELDVDRVLVSGADPGSDAS